ncbi:MAG: DUF6268 family outer membrane beta-barrel protein [Leeuwenhoekiella sp.]
MRNTIIILLFALCCVFSAEAQLTDLARVEYTFFPQKDSDNTFRRFRALVNLPLKLKKEGAYLVPGFEYRNVNLRLRDELPFSNKERERFQSFNLSLGYTFPLKNDWRFGARGGLIMASDFEGDVEADDFIFEGGVFFVKTHKLEEGDNLNDEDAKNWRLVMGIQYSTTAGRPFPLPFINYNVRVNEQWSYTLGVPKSNLKYYLNEKNVLQGFITLDGFYANLQKDTREIDGGVGQNISMTTLLSGVGYEHYFTDHLLLYFYGGHTIINDIRLRNSKGDDVFTINDTNTLYLRGGIKFKI